MSTPFEIESFEEYLQTVRNELPDGRKYFRGQTKLIGDGYELKPSIHELHVESPPTIRTVRDLATESATSTSAYDALACTNSQGDCSL